MTYPVQFRKKVLQIKEKLSIDESEFAHDMPRTHGYSIKSKLCYGKHNFGVKKAELML
jgi:hypothetical protein